MAYQGLEVDFKVDLNAVVGVDALLDEGHADKVDQAVVLVALPGANVEAVHEGLDVLVQLHVDMGCNIPASQQMGPPQIDH